MWVVEYGLSAGKVTLSSGLGATNIISGGPIQQISLQEIQKRQLSIKIIFLGTYLVKR